MLPRGRLKPVRVVREKVQEGAVELVPIPGPAGKDGTPGPKGLDGAPGQPGRDGFVPEHRWVGDEIQFQNPDGTWGKKRNLRGPSGGGGTASDTFKYTAITTATYTITAKQLIPGINMFGSRYDGEVTITLPPGISPNMGSKTIIINDETGNAEANIITVQVP